MCIKDINHVVLYAKNFYAHSGNVIADMKKLVRLDHHMTNEIESDEELISIMDRDYRNWVNSVDGAENYETCRAGSDKDNEEYAVSWDYSKTECRIWSILIKYSIYIPLHCGQFLPPDYTVMEPQKNIDPDIFAKARCGSPSNIVNEFLNRNRNSLMNDCMNELKFKELRKFMEENKKLVDVIWKDKTVDEIRADMDLGWQEFQKQYKNDCWFDENGNKHYPNRRYHINTEFFRFEFNTYMDISNGGSAGIDMQPCPMTFEVVLKNYMPKSSDETVEDILNYLDGIVDYEKLCEILCAARDKEFTLDEMRDYVKDILYEFIVVKECHYYKEIEETCGSTGCLIIDVKIDRDVRYYNWNHDYKITIRVVPHTLFSIIENSLYNTESSYIPAIKK